MKTISEPRWEQNGEAAYSVFRCTECHSAVRPNERYLIDVFNRTAKGAPRMCETCGKVALEKTRVRRARKNAEWLKHENCPSCRAPYPLSQQKPDESARSIILAGTAMRSVEAIAVEGGIDYVCGCKERVKRYTPLAYCKAHQYRSPNESFAGCCYVCEHPITSAARAYDRNSRKNNLALVLEDA